MAELCYLVLAAFESNASHLFQVEHNKIKYDCDIPDEDYFDDNIFYAFMIELSELNLKKGSLLKLWYDFGDDYRFQIKVIEIKEHQNILSLEGIKVISGCGYGIWEDAQYEMNLYYHNYDEFIKFIEENRIDCDAYPTNEEFNLADMNASLVEQFLTIRDFYESMDIE